MSMLVEQGVFTSMQTDRAEGYQLVVASPGMRGDDRQELSVWGPSHDSLVYADQPTASFNFFPLASGNYCVSRTTTSAAEYSGRAGARVYSHCLVVPPDTLARFANNPFALLRAAVAQGSVQPHDQAPAELPAIRLVGRCAPVDHGLLTDLIHDPGPDWLAGALAEMLVAPRWALATTAQQAPRLIAGLLNCLPPECRTDFSFTTGLRWSPRRPFRVICLPPDPVEIRRGERQQGSVYAIAGQVLDVAAINRGWAGYVLDVLRSGRTSSLATALSRPPSGLRSEELDAWGERLRTESDSGENMPPIDAQTLSGQPTDNGSQSTEVDNVGQDAPLQFPRLAEVSGETAPRGRRTRPATLETALPADSGQEIARPPVALELLDLLDDAVFDAIQGKQGAIDQLRSIWPAAVKQIAGPVLEESREHYIRRALAAWHGSREQLAPIDDATAVAVLDVLSVVLEP